MNTSDIRKNPFYTMILFQIEREIRRNARAAVAAGVALNDSQIRSTLNKVRKTAEGAKPQIPNATPRDQALAGLHAALLKVRKDLLIEDTAGQPSPLSTKEWTLCLRTIEESIQRHSTGPGSQGYLTFLESFLPPAE
jgi:hypothetical protein